MKTFVHPLWFFSRFMAWLAAWRRLRRLLAGLLFLLAGATPMLAQAAEMLFLTTDESATANGRSIGTPIINNGWPAFRAEAMAAGLTPIDGRGKLSVSGTGPASALPITPDTRLLVVITFDGSINADRLNELTNAMRTRPDMAIVIFSDGCCQVATNLRKLTEAASSIRPVSWPAFVLSATNYTPQYTAPLNTASLYASTFADAGLTRINGEYYTPINNVLLDYALYTQTALPASPPATVNNVVGLFIPQTASNNGQGACLFLTSDASEFGSGANFAGQHLVLAKAFTDAALDLNGACKQPVVGAPDLWVSLSEPEGPAVGKPSSITLTVGNLDLPGVTASTNGKVDVTLPAGLNLVPGSLPAGCSATATGLSCTLPALALGETKDFDFQIIAPAAVAHAAILAEVSGVTGEVNTANNTYRLEGISTPAGTPDLAAHLSGDTHLNVGAPSSVTLTVTNSNEAGVIASSDGQVEVTLPADLHLNGNPPAGCTATATGFSCQLPGLAPGASKDFQFEIIAPDPILADTSIEAVITHVTNEQNIANNTTVLHNITTLGSPDLQVTLSGTNALPVNTPSLMTLTVTNSDKPGVVTATGGRVEVGLPAGLELVTGSLPAGCTATASGFTCDVPNLTPGQSTSFDFQVIARAAVIHDGITAEASWNVRGGGRANSSATQLNVAIAQPPPTSVPTLAELALALLALAVAVSAAARSKFQRIQSSFESITQCPD